MVAKLDRDEIAALKEVEKGLMARRIDDELRQSLIAKGLLVQKLGGLALTAKGRAELHGPRRRTT